jgi:hypothetical protein
MQETERATKAIEKLTAQRNAEIERMQGLFDRAFKGLTKGECSELLPAAIVAAEAIEDEAESIEAEARRLVANDFLSALIMALKARKNAKE